MHYFRNIIFLFLSSLLLTNCSGESDKKNPAPRIIIYSPNAEPLNGGPLGAPTCEAALSKWFGRMDANQDGFIDKMEFMNDAAVQFRRMDIDKNGYLVSEELDRYRAPYRQAERTHKQEQNNQLHKRENRGRGEGGSNRDKSLESLTPVDPVMSADANLDFKVTPEEFRAQAEKIFAVLDGNHDGRLSRAEILAICSRKEEAD